MGVVERFNSLSEEEISSALPYHEKAQDENGLHLQTIGPSTDGHVSLYSVKNLPKPDFEACFSLIESTSKCMYKASSTGWSASKKRREMRLPDMRYLIFKTGGICQAFLSFMVTYEDGYEVIYCYEIHVSSSHQGQGIGRRLLDLMESVGKSACVYKAMLTVFLDNLGAIRFYERQGYAEDDFSPTETVLRNGTIKRPAYMILSKLLK